VQASASFEQGQLRTVNLKPLPKVVKTQVAEQAGNDGNNQIRDRKDIFNGEAKLFPRPFAQPNSPIKRSQ
jgi:hypothetical protein